MGYIGLRASMDTRGIDGVVSAAKTRSITLKGVRAGIKVLQPVAKAGAPRRKRSGALKQAQGTKAAKGRKGQTGAYAVQGAKTKAVKMVVLKGYKTAQKVVPALYDHLVQGGTRPHSLKKGSKVRGNKIARFVRRLFQGAEQHPGAKANPYRRRAYKAKKREIGQVTVKVMGEELQKVIAKQAARLAAKAGA